METDIFELSFLEKFSLFFILSAEQLNVTFVIFGLTYLVKILSNKENSRLIGE